MAVENVDINETICTKKQIEHMVDNYVPTMMRPNKWPDFVGIDIVDEAYIKEHFFDYLGLTTKDTNGPIVSGVVVDLATWFRAAGIEPTEEIMYVVFVISDRTWASTYLSLLGDISRIMLATEKSTAFAGSDAGARVSFLRAIDICEAMFPDRYLDIIEVAHNELKNLRS